MTHPRTRVAARLLGAGAGVALVAGLPAVAAAHGLSAVYQSPLPLAVYLAGAAVTVALSFAFVLARDLRAAPATDTRVVAVPRALRATLRAIGLVGHLAEELRNPLAREIWERTEEEASSDAR